jgi:hypothetical protein
MLQAGTQELEQEIVMMLAAEADLSLDERQSLIASALREQFGLDTDGCSRFYVYETFDAYVIARGPEGALFRIPYTIAGDQVSFGDAQEVETAFVPVEEYCAFAAESDSESGASDDDRVYPIVALRAGWARGAINGQAVPHYYPGAFVARVAEAMNSARFGRRHPNPLGGDPTGANDPDRIAGWINGGSYDAVAQEARGSVNLFDGETDLRSKLGSARKAKKLDLFGVSMLAAVGFKPGVIDGKQCMVAETLGNLFSIDLCALAGAGGQFIATASYAGGEIAASQMNAVKPNTPTFAPLRRGTQSGGAQDAGHRGATMKNTLKQLLEGLRKKNADKAADIALRFSMATEAEYPALVAEATTALTTDVTTAGAEQTAIVTEAATQMKKLQVMETRNRIEAKLTLSRLPQPAIEHARGTLEMRLASEAELADDVIDAEITRTRTAFAAAVNIGRVRPMTGGVILDSQDKLSLALEAAVLGKQTIDGVPAFRGIREAYIMLTGDQDLSRLHGGGFTCSGHVLASEAVASGDFPNLLLNSMTKRLLQDLAELGYDWMKSIYTKATINDYKSQDRVRDGYFGELPIVNENIGYQEATKPTDEKVNYTIQKRGELLTISEETIRNDDLGAIARFPGRLARAGRNTLRSYITAFFAANGNYLGDAVSWFNAAHNNLGSLALSVDSLIANEIALLTQTEKDSGEALGLPLTWIMVPPALAATARAINQSNTAGSNQFFQRFGANNERIFVNEKLTDVTDYYYGTDQGNAPFLEIGFLDGIEEPQIFLANQPTVGTQFTADQLQYKVKFPFGGVVTDFRGVGKNVVAG